MPSASAPRHRVWTTRELLGWISGAFADRGMDAPRLSAELLVAHVANTTRLGLYTDPDRPSAPSERAALRDLVARALRHEPIQYLVGEWPFFGVDLLVDRRALIPRPSTELLCETILQSLRAEARTDEPLRIADVCTGSGCIAIALATHLPNATVIATDLSHAALGLAEANVAKHSMHDRIELRRGDLLAALEGEPRFDVIAANPPYIPDDEWEEVSPTVKDHEPVMALRAGPLGLDAVGPLIRAAPDHLAPGAALVVEIAAASAPRVLDLARDAGLADARVLRDHEDLPRCLVARHRAGV